MLYYDMTSNGIPWPGQPNRLIQVHKWDKAEDTDVSERFGIDSGATRCLRLDHLDGHWLNAGLVRFAKEDGRTLERLIALGVPDGRQVMDWPEYFLDFVGKPQANEIEQRHYANRAVEIRFASIKDADSFRRATFRCEDCDGSYCEFIEDPCMKANGVHN